MSTQYMTLVGAEQVQNAANRIAGAAEQMARVASNLDAILDRHAINQDAWLDRLQAIFAEHEKEMGIIMGGVR